MLEIEDDGAGIDVERVAQRARAMGLVSTRTPSCLPDALLDVICTPGLLDARDGRHGERARRRHGRGARRRFARSAASCSSHSELGRGTRFTIELPLTLMITDALIMEIGDQAMAIPQVALREIVPSTRRR